MRITPLRNLGDQKKNKSADSICQNQQVNLLAKINTKYQLNALLTFKKPSKIGKRELLQILCKKNSTLQGTFTVQNNKILLITQSKQAQKPPTSFRKKYMKTLYKKCQNLNQSVPTIKEEINISSQRKHISNIECLKKYFNKNHLFDDQNQTSGQIAHLKGLKLIINDKNLQQSSLKQGEDWRLKRLEKQKGKVEFINNFMRTRYKTVQSGKLEYQQKRQITATNSLIFLGTQSQRRNNGIFQPWEKKDEYDEFQI